MRISNNCYDSAQTESFFARFKAELVEGGIFESIVDARSEVFKFLLKTQVKLSIVIQPSGARRMKFNPTVLKAEPPRELCWLGSLWIRGLFDGEHIFIIEPITENRVRFIQREKFSGLLVPLFWRSLDTDTRRGFKEMNVALKERAENPKEV